MLHHGPNDKKNSEVVSLTWTYKSKHAFLIIIPIKIIGPRKAKLTYAHSEQDYEEDESPYTLKLLGIRMWTHLLRGGSPF